jgi:hypothetical protein
MLMSIDNDVMMSTDDNEERGQNNLYKSHFEGIVALYGQHILAGKKQIKNQAMQWHMQEMPACHCMAQFLNYDPVFSIYFPQSALEGGRHYDRNGSMVVGLPCSTNFGFGRKSVAWQKNSVTAGPKIQKARQTTPSMQKEKLVPPFSLDSCLKNKKTNFYRENATENEYV